MRKDKHGFPISPDFPRPKKTPIQETAPTEESKADSRPKPLGLNSERLWEIYSIKSEWPTDKKIELLIIMWKLTVDQIADILGMYEDDVKTQVQQIEDAWRNLGRTLSKEERELERGRQIAELDRLRSQLEEAYIIHKDPKYLIQKANVLERLAKLRGLEQDKHVEKGEKRDGRTLQEKIDSMPADKNRELLERLKLRQFD